MQTKNFLILVYNTKVTEIEAKIPSVAGLANTAALTTVENKIPDISNFIKTKDYDRWTLDLLYWSWLQ